MSVAGFSIDRYLVTNARFTEFVAETGYVTIAERPLDPTRFPGAPPENLVPGSMVFTPTAGPVWAMLPDAETTERFGVLADSYKLSWEQARTGLADPQVQRAAPEALTLAADRLALDGLSLTTALTAWGDGPAADGRTRGDEALQQFDSSRADLGLAIPPGFE